MECHGPITKQNQITMNKTEFLQSNCDMCDSSPCIMICKQEVEKSHNILEKTVQNQTTKTEICRIKLCGLAYKHRCVVHIHRGKGSQNTLISDATYLTHIKIFLNDSTEKSKNKTKFWNNPYSVSKCNKYYRHCRIYDVKEEQSKEYVECCKNFHVRVNNKTFLMSSHVNDMMFSI